MIFSFYIFYLVDRLIFWIWLLIGNIIIFFINNLWFDLLCVVFIFSEDEDDDVGYDNIFVWDDFFIYVVSGGILVIGFFVLVIGGSFFVFIFSMWS